MTPQQALTIIEASVKEACPEIMELKLGCNILIRGLGRHIVTQEMADKIFQLIPVIIDGYKLPMRQGNIYVQYFTEEFLLKENILGHDITLEHVLKALVKRSKAFTTDEQDTFVGPVGKIVEILEAWFLGKPLHEQSDPCKLFLAEIFGK